MSFARFKSAYPNGRGVAKAKERWEKAGHDKDIEDILAKLDSEKKWRIAKKNAGEFVPEWPMISTYVNQERWADILPDCNFSELRDKAAQLGKCRCGAELPHGQAYCDTCAFNYPSTGDHGDTRRLGEAKQREYNAYAESHGLHASPEDWCRLLGQIRKRAGTRHSERQAKVLQPADRRRD